MSSTTYYSKRMTDAYDDPFAVQACGGQVHLTDADVEGLLPDERVAHLAFTPDGALKLARRLTKAAEVAYEQERRASL